MTSSACQIVFNGEQKKGWMNSELFYERLLAFNGEMTSQNRIVLLFLDNFGGHQCAYHEEESLLTHVKVEWLPPNCTSIVQPIDQGIGCALKIRYRKYLHEHMETMIMMNKDPMDGIYVLRPCIWIVRAWNTLNNSKMVISCFHKAGFGNQVYEDLIENHSEDDINSISCEEQALMAEDDALANPSTCLDSNVLMTEELAACREVEFGDTISDTLEETIECIDDGEQPVMNSRQATKLLFLETFFLHHNMHEEATWVSDYLRKTKNMAQKGMKQAKIDQFMQPF